MKCEKCNKTEYIKNYKGQNLCTLHRLELKKKEPEYLERRRKAKREWARRQRGVKEWKDEYFEKNKIRNALIKEVEKSTKIVRDLKEKGVLNKAECGRIINRLTNKLK